MFGVGEKEAGEEKSRSEAVLYAETWCDSSKTWQSLNLDAC